MSYRAKDYLDEAGVSLGELVRLCGRSKATWSRFLSGERAPATGDPRAEIETVLQERGVGIPRDLWEFDGTAIPAAPISSAQEEVGMQGQSLSPAAMSHFQLFRSPFDAEALITPDGGDHLEDLYLPISHQLVVTRLVQAYSKARFVAIAGEPGSGKTTLNQLAERRANEIYPVIRVTPANVERRKLTAMHIAAEIIRQLSESTVPRTANARDALAAEILKQRYEQGQRVALVIDEAHELPTDTIKDLKRYHEFTHGFARLLAIILIGQSELAARFDIGSNYRLREVIIRCEFFSLPPMRQASAGYLATRFKWVGRDVVDVFEPAALQAIEDRLAVHDQQLPVIISNVATAAMNIAARRGNKLVTDEDVEEVWSYTPEQLQEFGL